MATILVSYDLNKPGQNYDKLYEYLKGHNSWWHCLDSTWLIVTPLTAERVRDDLQQLIDANDRALVIRVDGDSWATTLMPKNCVEWLQSNM